MTYCRRTRKRVQRLLLKWCFSLWIEETKINQTTKDRICRCKFLRCNKRALLPWPGPETGRLVSPQPARTPRGWTAAEPVSVNKQSGQAGVEKSSSSHNRSSSLRHSSFTHAGSPNITHILLSHFASISHLSTLAPSRWQLQRLARSRQNVLPQDDLMFTIYKRAEEKPQNSYAQGRLHLDVRHPTVHAIHKSAEKGYS